MGLCRDCRYWSGRIEGEHTECIAVLHYMDFDFLHARAYVTDYERYGSSLMTRADFGCVLFEGKGS